MRYLILASDYDGTLAHQGGVEARTEAALKRLLASGRQFILVTGRIIPTLLPVFPAVEICTLVVAENGAVLYEPRTGKETTLVPPPPPAFVAALRKRGVHPLEVGQVVVATWRQNDVIIKEVIKEQDLDLQLTYNKDAVMVLPRGVTKAFGLQKALERLSISPQQTVGVGDAENDHALLSLCGIGVAVANALPSLREEADLVTRGDHGAGVTELIERMLADDLAGVSPRLRRDHQDLEEAEHRPEKRG